MTHIEKRARQLFEVIEKHKDYLNGTWDTALNDNGREGFRVLAKAVELEIIEGKINFLENLIDANTEMQLFASMDNKIKELQAQLTALDGRGK